jgi:hypothetical protein
MHAGRLTPGLPVRVMHAGQVIILMETASPISGAPKCARKALDVLQRPGRKSE